MTRKLNLGMTNETAAHLARLVKVAELPDEATVIARALALYDFVVRETGLGRKLCLQADDGTLQEVVVR